MNERKFNLHDGRMGSAITVHVVPGSTRNSITGILEDGTVMVGLAEQKVDEKANHTLVNFLADLLEVKASQLEVIGGAASNVKLVTIMDLDKNAVQSRILQYVK